MELHCGAVDAAFDEAFLERAARSDDDFATLKRHFERLVWSVSYGYGFDRSTREDVAQLVWLKLFQNLSSIRDPSRLAGWLATTTRRECFRLAKARVRVQAVEWDDEPPDSSAPELDARLIRDETVRLVAQALDAIDSECRQLLRLLSAEPALTYQEIADILQSAPGSIGPWRQRCLRKLARRPEIRDALGAGRGTSGGVTG